MSFPALTRSITIVAAALALACSGKKEEKRFELLAPSATGIHFENTITESDSINLLDYEYVYNGGGVAVIDVNGDELQDLLFTGNMVPSKLYLNQGNFKFKDITSTSGISKKHWATGAAVADVNADGIQDIYICSAGHLDEDGRANLLYINNGDNTFTERASAYGLDDKGFSTMAAFFDYDRDEDLDLYVVTYANDTWDTNVIYPKVKDGSGKATDRLYRNNGNGTFTNVSREAGILIEGYGLGVAISDINQDGWPDIYVANDYIDDDLIYINNRDGSFTESAAKMLNHISQFAMGNDIADINNDAYPDIMVVDMQPEDNERQKLFSVTKNYDKFMMSLKMDYLPAYMRNTLQLNNGNGTFSEIGQLAGIHHTDWSWAPLFTDLDNDGYKDLFITNGYPKDIMNRDFLVYNKYATSIQAVRTPATLEEQHRFKLQAINELQGTKINNYFFRNNGDLTFENKSEEWGIAQPTFSNGAAYVDLDNDGDIDIVSNNINDPASVYENKSEAKDKNNYIRLKLQSSSRNRFALGAKVKLYSSNSGTQFLENYPYRGFQSSVESVMHFGIGSEISADSIIIEWPDGKFSALRDVPANRLMTVHHSDAQYKEKTRPLEKNTPFRNVTAAIGLTYTHKEVDYNDFKVQPLLPHKFSQGGPGIAVADVNGDGRSDFYIAGGQTPGALFIQTKKETFIQKDLGQKSEGDQMGALFFDADGDQDQDLYVVVGGNEHIGLSPYEDRLYINDGAGNFSHDTNALPKLSDNGSCVAAADYDGDGDLDLFVGGRIHAGKYPLPGRSYLLRNENGLFKNVTEEVGGPSFSRMGIVSTAIWTDVDNDGQVELMVAGEWMPITIFKLQNGQFRNITNDAGLEHTTGWWNSLASGDFDNDGDIDYVAGNAGMNSRYKPSEEEPLNLYTKDFDDNATLDPFMTYYLGGKKHIVHSRDEVIGQVSMMRKKYPGYADFAKSEFEQMFTRDDLRDSYVLKCETFKSSYLENLGNGKFSISTLPLKAQFSPIFGMIVMDINGDGNLDLLTVGNSFAPEISLGRYDASYGCVLIGDGNGSFKDVDANASGFVVRGDAKGLASIILNSGRTLSVVTKNNGAAEAFVSGTEEFKIVRLMTSDASAIITFDDGRKQKLELHYGSGYLSHSDRVLQIPMQADSVEITTFANERRIISAEKL